MRKIFMSIAVIIMPILPFCLCQALDYKDALGKSLLYFDGQRSGKLPSFQQITWRSDSGLMDGLQDAGIPLVGGYHDAGDNVMFGFPMAFSMTLLAWSIVEYASAFQSAGQYQNALNNLKWGTDFMILSHTSDNVYWMQVGDGNADHACWQRPEDQAPRPAFQVNSTHPGTEVVAEAAAALAAASIVFNSSNPEYSSLLLIHARKLFIFGDTYRGNYSQSVPQASMFYNSYSGYNDELLWAAIWLYKATGESQYMQYLKQKDNEFAGSTYFYPLMSWDNKRPGVDVLMANVYLTKNYDTSDFVLASILQGYIRQADNFVCASIAGSPTKTVQTTNEGQIIFDGVNSQQSLGVAMLDLIYSDYLTKGKSSVSCGGVSFTPAQIMGFGKSQVDYLLGANKAKFSYMVGFGPKYPLYVHHRAASIPALKVLPTQVGCKQGYSDWYSNSNPNPNVFVGAIVGGPIGQDDSFTDVRSNYAEEEPSTYINAAAVGALAKLYSVGLPPTPPPRSSSPPPPFPPPPPHSSSPPPPPPHSSSPPPSHLSSLSPPPSPRKTSSPPISPPSTPSPGKLVTVACSVTSTWPPAVTQYNCVVTNTNSKSSASNITLSVSNFNVNTANFYSWNIIYNSATKTATLPSYAQVLAPSQSITFGYQQQGAAAMFSVIR